MKRESFDDLLTRLSERSVDKHFDAYADIDWEAPEFQIDPSDPRFELPDDMPLGGTDWYRSLPQARRAEIGLAVIAQQMKVGLIFESILSRGLLRFAVTQPNGSAAFRYAYHEVIEESQHTLMFQEFINRSGMEPPGLTGIHKLGSNLVPGLGQTFPEMFFLFVLGGEGPIDYVQRKQLDSGRELHPLLERIIRIHVLEEARHICFAKRFLTERVPQLSFFSKWHLKLRTPIVLSLMAQAMLEPPAPVVMRYGIPGPVVAEAYQKNPQHRRDMLDGLAPIRELCAELGIVSPATVWIWQKLGIWPEQTRLLAASS